MVRVTHTLFCSLVLAAATGRALVAQQPVRHPAVIGVVLDGPSAQADSVRQLFEHEIAATLGEETPVQFAAQFRLTADYSVAGINAAIDRLLADKRVDVVLALGAIGSDQLAHRHELAKPAIAALVIDARAQDLPWTQGASGVRNLTYLDMAYPVSRMFHVFRDVLPYRHLVILVHPSILGGVPRLGNQVRQQAESLGVSVSYQPVTNAAAPVLTAIPTGTDAVAIGPVDALPPAGLDSLIKGLAARKIAVFSLRSRSDVAAGALASYEAGDDLARRARRVATTLQRLAGGEDAGDLPVALASIPQLTLNLATARTIGFSPSWSTLTEAVLLNEAAPVSGPVWSLATVGHEAISANLDLQASNQSVVSGKQEVRIGRSPLLPQVRADMTGTLTREATAASSLGQQAQRQLEGTVQFSQQIYDDQSWAGYRIARYVQDTRVADRKRTELEVVLRATTAYLNVLKARALARVERENVALTRSNLDQAELKEQVGAAGRSDVYRWQAELAQSRRRVLDADSRARVAELELNGALNHPLEERFTATDATVSDSALLISEPRLLALLANPASFAVFRDFAVQEGLEASPEIQALDAQIKIEERKGTTARRSYWLPTFTLEGGTNSVLARGGAGAELPDLGGLPLSRGPDNSWSIQLKASRPLFTGFKRSSESALANSEVVRLRLVRQSAAVAVSQQIRSSLEVAAAAWANITEARAAASAARQNLEIVSDAYARGVTPILTLLDAQEAALSANEAAADAVYDFLIALMNSQRARGSYDFFYTPQERSAFYQRLEGFATAAGVTSARN